MKGQTSNASDGIETVTVRVAMTFRKRGGRRLMVVAADSAEPATKPPATHNAGARALARAYRWRSLYESGQFVSIAELAAAEKVDKSYLSKVIRLTLLAPIVVEGIIDDTQDRQIHIERLLAPFPIGWELQRQWFSR